MHVHGNRGRCAQPCRLPYELIKVEQNKQPDIANINQTTLDKGYLLSTKDLCSLDLLPTLVNLGIKSFKIEGRLKNPEYVATVTRIYRKYIDLAQSNKPYIVEDKDKKDLLQVFNRGGFSTGYLENKPNSNLIYKNKPNNMGIFLGNVLNFNNNKGYITLKLQEDIKIGDNVSLENEKGLYTISELMINNKNTPYAKKGDIVKIGRIKGNIFVNDKIFKLSSKDINTIANNLVNSENIKVKINCKIIVHKGQPISINIFTNSYKNINFTITSDLIPVDSINSPITKDRIIEQINKLGGTPFEFENIDVDLDENLYIPSISKLNQLRRDGIHKLEELILDKIHRSCNIDLEEFNLNKDDFNKNISQSIGKISKINHENSLKKVSILLNDLNENYDYTKLQNIDKIYIPLKYFCIKNYNKIITDIINNFNTYIYMPCILKDSILTKVRENIENIIIKYEIKGFVISNISHINLLEKYTDNYEFIANYNMNIYNNYTVSELQDLHFSCITISPELDKLNINSLCSNIQTESIIYGNLPVMTTNYCLLSKNNSCLQTCKNNCNNHNTKYYLKDRLNLHFRVIPDYFSKTTTIYNSKKLSVHASELDIDCIRLDFMDENIDYINNIIEIYINNNICEGSDYTNGNLNRLV